MNLIPYQHHSPELFLIEAQKEVDERGGFEPYMVNLCDHIEKLWQAWAAVREDAMEKLVFGLHFQRQMMELYESELRAGSFRTHPTGTVINSAALQKVLADQVVTARQIH